MIIIIIAAVMLLGGSKSSKSLVGTWTSSVSGKGLEGAGTITTAHTVTKLTATGDVNLVIQEVENGVAIGTITYSNLCLTAAVSVSGRAAVTEPAKCVNVDSKSVQAQITGNAITFGGTTVLGGTVLFTGTYSNDTISGTFKQTSSYGEVDGTFSLMRTKN